MMKPTSSSILALLPKTSLAAPASIRPLLHARPYATQNSLGTTPQGPRRRKVTPFNDDGFVPWNELSASEKTARATQQTFNFGLIIVGIVFTGGAAYFMWHDVFAPDSKIAHFNRAVDKVKLDPRCIELLGNAKKIYAHGDETFNKWRRARPVASTERTDRSGNIHLQMHFFVEGPLNNGVVQLHMIKNRNSDDFEYNYLFLDVKGHERIYLEKADASGRGKGKKQINFLGYKWG